MYIALYRKWRPQRFEDICGQEHITVTLKNELEGGKISHAYLFCGTRGTGKTSTAKLLAKAVNCEAPYEFNPCNECESCISINEGNSIDVYEIDAASNRGIDDIRNLREAIRFTPTLGKYKVYIIDEVHMLTNEAFNALLKTLEEPPDYVLFILATTEPHKLPATILSRCQRFDFKRISNEDIVERLKIVCREEGLEIGEDAIKLIARNSDGAMRDALSILDQCSVYSGKTVTNGDVLEVLGIVNDQYLFDISGAVLKEDAGKAIKVIDEVAAGGKDISQFIKDLVMHYRNLLMTKVVVRCEDVIDMSEEGILRLKELSGSYDKNNIIRCINILSELEGEVRWSSSPRILLEIAIAKMCRAAVDESLEGILARISKLEELVSREGFYPKTGGKLQTDDLGASAEAEVKREKTVPPAVKVKPDPVSDGADIVQKWPGFIQEIKGRGKIRLRTYLSIAKSIKAESGSIILSFDKEGIFSKEALELPANRADVEEAASKYFGIPIKIKCIIEGEAKEEEQDNMVKAAIEFAGKDKVEIVEEEEE
ncbi:MAG TPA: DNA polymerase III subunit gamma/tau [Bacillota bacterium]|nr:DNA polymerase III subunit gamma/tau [Bacillota bacterium]HPL52890.1 DNA polymerase III subunit gamma/tau [Bacillota bacterium]